MIYTHIAYSPNGEKNLGKAYNDFMELLPDDAFALFLDHDIMLLTYGWYPYLEAVLKEHPDCGLFTCFTNRVNCRWQIASDANQRSNDIKYHRQFAVHQNASFSPEQCIDVTHKKPCLSGFFILISKKVWKKIGKFKDGITGVDNDIHIKAREHGEKVMLIQGMYVYHWYRNGNLKDTKHLE